MSRSNRRPSRAPREPVVHLAVAIGGVEVRVVEADIALSDADVVVNAANNLSFMPMDGGVSGALRRACAPADVCGKIKTWVDDDGNEHRGKRVPTTQAGIQQLPDDCGLAAAHVVHAVGPTWTDWSSSDPRLVAKVAPRIRKTVKRALSAADRVGARAVALPAVSGGIFTHWAPRSDIKRREQVAARRAVVQAVVSWAAGAVSVERIDLIDSERSVEWFREALEGQSQAD